MPRKVRPDHVDKPGKLDLGFTAAENGAIFAKMRRCRMVPIVEQPYEKDFQKHVLKRLRKIPYSYWEKINDRTTIGLPDIWGCCAGRFVTLELKSRSKPSAIQRITIKRQKLADALAFVEVSPKNLEDVLATIAKVTAPRRKELRERDRRQKLLVDSQLTGISVAYCPDSFISDRVFPVLPEKLEVILKRELE